MAFLVHNLESERVLVVYHYSEFWFEMELRKP